ncbi:MAG: ATP-dependent RecD-like DNA helicase [Verrucomicrobiae bacterium]|nr:ATP-dependent RecD-like DNA helicase [Verrucomicrobiae bacterium]
MQPLETVEGTVERIIYANEETQYTVATLLPEGRGRREPIVIVGNLASLNVGETVRAQGRWTHHKQFGRQFVVEKFESVLPRTVVGIKKYLASGLVKGIGEKFAERIVSHFGAKTFEVIEHFSARLQEVEGIGPERARRIKEAWNQQRAVRDIMIFLQGHGISSSHAAKIYKRYGATAIDVVRENPYRLAQEISGIGFKTADGIAARLGIAADSVHRLKAGVVHALAEATDEGHCCLPHETLINAATRLLGVERAPVEHAVQLLAETGDVVIDEGSVYLAGMYHAECAVARKIRSLAGGALSLPPFDLERALAWVQQKTGVELAEAQQQAVRMALTSKLSVITGGPGVGKTTIVNSIVQILRAKNCRVLLAAPTGRAAKRLSEATGEPAQTIHRLLRYDPRDGGFSMNEQRPLEADMLIIDETSMLDVPLAHHLLKAVPAAASVLFVGDVDQLPSVGPGNFLRDIIESGLARVARLTEIFRQAKNSFIVINAHRVNAGQMPVLDAPEESDFFFIRQEDPDKTLATVRALCVERVPKKFRLDPMRDIQVLTPMHKGVCGAENLNRELAAALNPSGPCVQRVGRTLRVGDRVMQIRNNYDKDVFNGDMGRVKSIDLLEQQLVVEMDERDVAYDFDELDELVPAYAISVHKSQGNEYPCVIVPLLTQHYVLLQRNLLYTAITRGRKLVILVGSPRALAIAVRNNRTAERHTKLRQRLRTAPPEHPITTT